MLAVNYYAYYRIGQFFFRHLKDVELKASAQEPVGVTLPKCAQELLDGVLSTNPNLKVKCFLKSCPRVPHTNLTCKTLNRHSRDGMGLTKAYNGTRRVPWQYRISRAHLHVTHTGSHAATKLLNFSDELLLCTYAQSGAILTFSLDHVTGLT